MSIIPEELLEQLERGNVLLLIGEGINQGVLPSSQELAAELAKRCDYPPEEPKSFARVASYYELTRNRHGLVMFLRERLLNTTRLHSKSALHQLVTRLGVRVIVTTCVDQLLVQALNEAKIEHTQVVGNSDVAYSDEERLLLVNLWGVLEQPDSLVITERDQWRFLDGRANLSDVLRGELAQRTWLFIGFDASDEWFRGFYEQVTGALDRHRRRAYILGSQLDAFARLWWQKRNAEILHVESQPFLQQLVQEVEARRRPTPAIPSIPLHLLRLEDEESPLPLPERPYKFLDYYEAQDAAIFYGRQQETQKLCALIHAHRLVVLYGASGVGKTSLLLAGAVPRLERATPPYKVIYIRALEDPSFVVRRTLRRHLPDADLPREGSLVDFLAAVTKTLGQPLLIVLDQFEEFFIRLSAQYRAAFISELGALYDATDVPVKVLFSLREDWLASMDEISSRIPDLSRSTRMRLLRLTRPQARQAITAPVERLGVSYEPELVERLLEDLLGSRQSVMPPQLQLVCSALYDGRRKDDRLIKVATYERLGGAQGVLGKYLEEQLSRLNPNEQLLARAILEELVTSENTKAVKSSTDLALALDAELDDLSPVLKRLVETRLVRTVKHKTGQSAYELAHEYLIGEIPLTADRRARKQAEELIQQEVENWQRFGTVLAADKLALISDVRDALRTGDDAQALLLHSALQVGQDVAYWLNRISDSTRRVELLSEATASKLPVMRQRAVQALGSQDVPPAIEPLVKAALHDSNPAVRDAACESLAQLTTQQPAIVARLKREAAADEGENRTSSIRVPVLKALTYLPLRGLPLRLRAEVLMMRIRLYVTSLIEASLATRQRRAIAMTTGSLLLLVVLAYALSANAYYVGTEGSPIPRENVIVIHRGQPFLNLPGIDQVLVETGINDDWIAEEHWEAVTGKSLWGLERQTVKGDYYKWGQDVANRLKLEHRVPMLWCLGQQEEAVQAILERTRSQDMELQLTSVQLLIQMLAVDSQLIEAGNPQLAEQVLAALLSLLSDEEWQVRVRAVWALAQAKISNPQLVTEEVILALLSDEEWQVRVGTAFAVAEVREPQLVTEQVIAALLPLLSDEDRDARALAASAVGQVAEANPQLVTEELIAALLPLLSDEESGVRGKAASALPQVLEGNPQLVTEQTEQLIAALLPLLSDEDWDARRSAAIAVGQVAEANPQLVTEQLIAVLLPLLSDEESDVRGNAASAVGQVAEANPQLVTKKLTAALLSLLSDEDSDVRAEAAFAAGQVGKDNSQLAEQVLQALLPLLEDEDSRVRQGTAFAVGRVAEGNPQLAEQVLQALLPLLSDEDRDVREGTASAVGQVGEGNSQLAEQVIAALLPLLEDEDSGAWVRGDAALALGQLVQANQRLAEQVLQALLPLLSDEDWHARGNAAIAVGQVGEANPQLVTEQVVAALLPLLEDEERHVRDSAVFAVGQVYAYQKNESFLFDALKARQKALERPVAAQALFLITLQEPSRDANIRQELQNLSNSPEPMERIWANKTLAMLNIAAEVHKSCPNEKECQRSVLRLEIVRNSRFFGEDLSWAARDALNWLEEQKNE